MGGALGVAPHPEGSQRMNRTTRAGVIALAVGAALAGAVVWVLPPGTKGTAPSAACRHGDVDGYALTGNVYTLVLRPVDLCPVALGQPILAPAETQRMSWLTGTRDRAVVADFSSGSDQILLVTPQGLAPVPGLGPQIGHTPTLASDGRIAYVETEPQATGEPLFLVHLYDPQRGQRSTIARLSVPPSGAAWGPAGELALIADTGSPQAQVLILDRPGAEPRRVATVPGALSVEWATPDSLIVTLAGKTPEEAHAVVLDAHAWTIRGRVAVDWRPVGVTRDGALVAVRSTTGEVARLAGPTYDVPDVYGVLPPGEMLWQLVL